MSSTILFHQRIFSYSTLRNECFVLQELNSPYDACVPASADLTQLECLEDSDCGRGTCHLGKCRTPWDTWWDTCSDRDKLVITTLRRALEETLERQREEDRLPPFMSSVTYKVPQIPWYTDPPPTTITGGGGNKLLQMFLSNFLHRKN